MLLTPHALLDIFETALGTRWKHNIRVVAVMSPKAAHEDVVFSRVQVARSCCDESKAVNSILNPGYSESFEAAVERYLREYDTEDNHGLTIVLGLFGGYKNEDTLEFQMGFIDQKVKFMGFEDESVEREC